MQYSFHFQALAALVSYSAFATAVALPIREASPGSFTIDVYRPHARSHHVRRAGSSPGPLSLVNGGSDWYCNGTAGGQPIDVLLDTGSADLWLVAPGDDSSVTSGVQTYDPTKSKTAKQMQGATFNIGYGEGGNGVSGDVYTDEFCLGQVCVNNMAIGHATHDQGLGNFPRSGIMGLAFSGGNSVKPTQQKTFMEMLQPQLAEPIMAFNLAPPGGNSQVTFGSVSSSSYQPPLQNITADGPSGKYAASWSFENVGYFKNGQNLGSFDIVFDTGAPRTTGNEAIVRAYYDGVPGAKDVQGDASSWTVPCGTKLPDLELHLGNAIMIIPGEKFYNGQTQTTGTCDLWFGKDGSSTRGAVGDPFYAQHVVIYNQQDHTIAWGNKA